MSDLIERLDACDARDTPRLAQDLLAEASAELTRLRSLVDQSGGGAATWHKLDDEGNAELRVNGVRITSFPSYPSAEEAASRINTALASPPHGGRILEGWRMVPVEPDVKMIAAWYQVKNTGSVEPGEWGEDRSDYAAYRAMLSAAPVSHLREEAR